MRASRYQKPEPKIDSAEVPTPNESPWDVEPVSEPAPVDYDEEWESMICALPDGPAPYNDGPYCDWETGEVLKPKAWQDNPDNLTDPAECKCSYSRSSHTVFCPGNRSRQLGQNESDPFAGKPKVPYRDRVSEGRCAWKIDL
jgi:hypothetical protein